MAVKGGFGVLRWFKNNWYHLLFGISICALIALDSWWTVFISRSITKQYQFHMSIVKQAGRFLAYYYNEFEKIPEIGKSSMDDRFWVVECRETDLQSGFVAQMNRWPQLCVVPDRGIIEAIEKKFKSQRLMITGKGTLLFVLLSITIFMLWRFYNSEKRFVVELERFVEILTHRLKGPSSGISVLLETIKGGRIPPEKLDEMIELGLVELERQHQIINNILIACRRREKPWKMTSAPVRLLPIIEAITCRWKRLGREMNFNIEVHVGEDDTVVADETGLRMALENIIDNSFKYSKSEGGNVKIFSKKRAEGSIELNVVDDGIGISSENLKRIFEPLWRGSPERKGSGLGLYISKKIIEDMGGTLSVESEGEGKGTRVKVVLKSVGDRRR